MATANLFVLLAALLQPAVAIKTFAGIVAFAALPGIAGLSPGATESTLSTWDADSSEFRYAKQGKSHNQFSLPKQKNSSAAVQAHTVSPLLHRQHGIIKGHDNNNGVADSPVSLIQTGAAVTDMQKPSATTANGAKQSKAILFSPNIFREFMTQKSWWESLEVAGRELKRVLNSSPSELITSMTGFSPWTLQRQKKFASIPGKHTSIPDILVTNEATTKETFHYICVTVAVGILAVLQIRGAFTQKFKNKDENGKSRDMKSMRKQPFIIELPQGVSNSKLTRNDD